MNMRVSIPRAFKDINMTVVSNYTVPPPLANAPRVFVTV